VAKALTGVAIGAANAVHLAMYSTVMTVQIVGGDLGAVVETVINKIISHDMLLHPEYIMNKHSPSKRHEHHCPPLGQARKGLLDDSISVLIDSYQAF
jgi:hypothetical protein